MTWHCVLKFLTRVHAPQMHSCYLYTLRNFSSLHFLSFILSFILPHLFTSNSSPLLSPSLSFTHTHIHIVFAPPPSLIHFKLYPCHVRINAIRFFLSQRKWRRRRHRSCDPYLSLYLATHHDLCPNGYQPAQEGKRFTDPRCTTRTTLLHSEHGPIELFPLPIHNA